MPTMTSVDLQFFFFFSFLLVDRELDSSDNAFFFFCSETGTNKDHHMRPAACR